VTDRHYALDLSVVVQGDGAPSQQQSFQRGLSIQNDSGTVVANLSTATDEDTDPNTTGYTISETVSGTDVLIQVAAALDAVSAGRAVGLSVEHAITGA
jgi:hypothetical protein